MLILRALGLGDLLTAVPALRAIASAYPSHERLLAAPRTLAPLAALIRCPDGAPAVHRVAHAVGLDPLPAGLSGASVAVNLHGRGPQSHRLLQAARPGRSLWLACPEVPESAGSPEWRAREHEVRRWCRMLSEQGVPASPDHLYLDPPPGEPPAGTAGATLLHPGAADGARRWPAERFLAVARAESERGARVVLTGSEPEAALCGAIASQAGLAGDSVLAGRTDLADLARAVAAADRVVCGDTGMAHLATALGTPSVVLFGPTAPAEWGPPPARRRHRVLWAGMTGDPHGATPSEGLLEIGVPDVLGALEELPLSQRATEAA